MFPIPDSDHTPLITCGASFLRKIVSVWNLVSVPLNTSSSTSLCVFIPLVIYVYLCVFMSLPHTSSICYILYLNKYNHHIPVSQAQNFGDILKNFIFVLKYFLSLSQVVSDPVSWFLRYLSPLVLQSGLLAIILGPVIIRLVRSIPVVSWVLCSILSPKLAPNPSLIKWIILPLKIFNVSQLHIKQNQISFTNWL